MAGISGEYDLSGISNQESTTFNTITTSNYYSGSLNYELSFLRKDHTIIINLDKTTELFDGTGEHGIILIPNNLKSEVRNNLDFYIQQASALLGLGGNDFTSLTYQNENPME